MSRSALRHLRLLGPVTLAATLAIGALPTHAQTTTGTGECSGIRFELSNPDPGAMLQPGAIVVQGVAQDERATEGNGIERVDFFLDNREEGGMFLGQASFGTGNMSNMWSTTVTLPNNQLGPHTLFFYAHSTASGEETVTEVPVTIAE